MEIGIGTHTHTHTKSKRKANTGVKTPVLSTFLFIGISIRFDFFLSNINNKSFVLNFIWKLRFAYKRAVHFAVNNGN